MKKALAEMIFKLTPEKGDQWPSHNRKKYPWYLIYHGEIGSYSIRNGLKSEFRLLNTGEELVHDPFNPMNKEQNPIFLFATEEDALSALKKYFEKLK